PELSTVAIVGICVGIFGFFGLTGIAWIGYKRREADKLWRIPEDAIVWPEPTQILGKGTYGIVLAGNFRGVAVAVKQAS
ncbi:unnamed protein product, partial [Phaeothamnion confervicola]